MAKGKPRPLADRVVARNAAVADKIGKVIINPPLDVRLRAGVPPVPEHYVPRKAMMAELAGQLGAGDRATVTGRAVASGDGGHGKTVLAYAYALQFKKRYPGGCDTAQGHAETRYQFRCPIDQVRYPRRTDEHRVLRRGLRGPSFAVTWIYHSRRCMLHTFTPKKI